MVDVGLIIGGIAILLAIVALGLSGYGLTKTSTAIDGAKGSPGPPGPPGNSGVIGITGSSSSLIIQGRQVFEINAGDSGNSGWSKANSGAGVTSETFSVGGGSKLFNASFSAAYSGNNNMITTFDIINSTGNVITTLTFKTVYNGGGIHLPYSYTKIIPVTNMPSGQYKIRAKSNQDTDSADFLYATIVSLG